PFTFQSPRNPFYPQATPKLEPTQKFRRPETVPLTMNMGARGCLPSTSNVLTSGAPERGYPREVSEFGLIAWRPCGSPVEEVAHEAGDGEDGAVPHVPAEHGRKVNVLAGVGTGGGGQPAPLLLHVLHFPRARLVHPAGADEFHDAVKMIAVEPCAVLAANIDDDAGDVGKIDAVHHRVADRAAQVANLLVD